MSELKYRRFGQYPVWPGVEGLLTAESSHIQGFKTGLQWKESYTPSGPYILFPESWKKDPDYLAYCAATIENNNEWIRGFTEARNAMKIISLLNNPQTESSCCVCGRTELCHINL